MNWFKHATCDLCRYKTSFTKAYFLIPGFKYMFYIRLFDVTPSFLRPLVKLKILLMQRRYGIQIPWGMKIGKGFYIGHFGTIIVNGSAVIGENVNISQSVTIGQTNIGGGKSLYPIIGDRVYIAPGAKIIGGVTIGDDVAIGANAVVTKDIPSHTTAVGIPAKVISEKGSANYINNKYE